MSSISNLPNEILLKVCLHLPFESVLASLLVNRRFYAVLKANWKKMNTQFEVEKMTLRTQYSGDEIEFSLNTAYSGMIELSVRDLRAEFIYDEAAEDSALVRAITRYFRQKGANWKPYNIAFGHRNSHQFKHDRPLGELRELLLYGLPLIDIRKFVAENLSFVMPTYMDCIIRCIEDTSSSRSKGVPVELQGIYYQYPKLCRALRSPEAVFTDLSDFGISLLETSLEIPIRLAAKIFEASLESLRMSSLSDLPNEILLKVCLYLPFESVLSSLLVNRRLYSVLKANWEKMNTQFEVETLRTKCYVDQIEFSLKTAYSGLIELSVKKFRVAFMYEEAAKDSALVRAITHYLKQKGAYWRSAYFPMLHSKTGMIFLFRHVCLLEELRDLLFYLLPLIEIRKFVGENFTYVVPTYMDCIIRCIEDTSSSRSKGVQVELQGEYSGYPKLCRALRSPEAVFTDLTDYGIWQLDTSFEIPIRVLGFKNIQNIAELIRTWHIGIRSIFQFTSESSSEFFISTIPISYLQTLVTCFDRFCIIRETDTEILIELRRPNDAKILEISYVIRPDVNVGGKKSSAKEI